MDDTLAAHTRHLHLNLIGLVRQAATVWERPSSRGYLVLHKVKRLPVFHLPGR